MADTKSEEMTLLGVEIREIGTPGDHDEGLLAAIAKLEEEGRLWYAAKGNEHNKLLRKWIREGRMSLGASVAACVPQTRAGLIAKADYGLRHWREREPTPDRYVRAHATVFACLEHALAALQEADRG